MEAVVCTTLTAHSEPYNRAALHASRLGQGANALWSRDFGGRCGREKLRLAAATAWAASDCHRQSQCLRVLQRCTAVCAGAKNTKSLAACAGSCGVGSQPMPGANAMWNTGGQVLLGDVAARDVQAATSPANRIAPARTKSWRFAGGGLGSGGENRRGKGQVFGWPSGLDTGGQQILSDVAARNHGSQRRHRCGV